jgi:hypothetical protein
LVFSSLSPVTGQFVRIQLAHQDYLQLAEVQVFAADSAPQPTPEPATMLLFATGLAGLASVRPRRKKK